MNWKLNAKCNLSRVTLQDNMQRKINSNAFTRRDNKSYNKRIKEICKISPAFTNIDTDSIPAP